MFRIKGLTKKTIKRLSSIEEVIFILDEFNFVAKSGLKTTQKALELELRTTFKKEENAFDRKIKYYCKNAKEIHGNAVTIEEYDEPVQYLPTNRIQTQKNMNRKLGTIKCNGLYVDDIIFDEGIVSATDPCYDSNTWCRKDDIEIVPGKYQIYTFTDGDNRVRILQFVLADEKVISDFNNPITPITRSWRYISENIGVDAGLCGIFQHKPDFDDDEWIDDFCSNVNYNADGNMWTGKHPWQKGFFTESGWGDGMYTLSAIRRIVGPVKTPRIVALELRFC